jgi:hypothetical protein
LTSFINTRKSLVGKHLLPLANPHAIQAYDLVDVQWRHSFLGRSSFQRKLESINGINYNKVLNAHDNGALGDAINVVGSVTAKENRFAILDEGCTQRFIPS